MKRFTTFDKWLNSATITELRDGVAELKRAMFYHPEMSPLYETRLTRILMRLTA